MNWRTSTLFFVILFVVSQGNAELSDQIDISIFDEDVCWSSELDGCRVIGLNADYRQQREKFYWLASLGHFFSKHTRDPRGDPLLNSTTVAFGIGKKFKWPAQLDFEIEALIKLQADDDFGNSNSNSGPELKLRVNRDISDHWRIGTELAIQRFQNCSNADCHLLGSKKPVMRNSMAALFVRYRFSPNWALSYRIFDVAHYPDSNIYNGRKTEQPGQMLSLNWFRP